MENFGNLGRGVLTPRRRLLAFAAAPLFAAMGRRRAFANTKTTDRATPVEPILQLDEALLEAMKSGREAPFAERFRALEPVVEQAFDLEAVLAASVGPAWTKLTDAEKATLAFAFRRCTVASYVAAFDTYKGESFRILPGVRTLGGNKVLVQTRLLKGDGPPVRFDYVMHLGSTGWRAVDLLLGGEISRVQLQRLYFEDLLRQGGAPALLAFLEWKLTDLSGPMV